MLTFPSSLIHRVLRPPISLDEARINAINAINACSELRMRWDEPVMETLTLRGRYRFWTRANSIGGNVIVFIDSRSGCVAELQCGGR
jgi:hypothetical protein